MKEAFWKTINSFKMTLPIVLGVFMLVNIVNPILKDYYASIFSGNYFLDPFIGALVGSISFGIPISGYVAGGELLAGGVSLLAVSAFILSWTTVGIVMLPLEVSFLGKKFALARNLTNFFLSILISIMIIATLDIFNL